MKKYILTNLLTIMFCLAIFIPAAVADHCCASDQPIRETDIDGYHFVYKLIDMKEKMKDMKNTKQYLKDYIIKLEKIVIIH